jgi:menaquinone-specific isochorismate synthase
MEPTRGEPAPAREVNNGAVRGRRVETPAVRSLLRVLERPQFTWVDGDTLVAGGGAAATITADGPGRFDAVREQAADVFERIEAPATLPESARPRLYGGVSFTDSHTAATSDTWAGFPGASFVLPAVQFTVTPETTWLTSTALGPSATATAAGRLERWERRIRALPKLEATGQPGIVELRYTPQRDHWREQVGAALERIHENTLEKVVLAQSLRATLERPAVPGDLLERLGESYPDCYRFLFAPAGGGTFFGATPERLVSRHGQTVETEALAGSIGRGDTDEEDENLAERLRTSEKNAHEHELVVESIRRQLSDVATDIRTGERAVRRLATVQHLVTPIRAELEGSPHVLELLEALHPTPAVGGLPPEAARRTIRETETFDRGWYAAPVGWFDGEGDGTFAVGIRSGLARDRDVTMFAGAGIVADSDPDREWDELQLKYGPVLDEL